DQSTDSNPSSYLRQPNILHKPHASHHPHHTSTSTSRSSLVPTSQISPHHGSPYMFHNIHSSPVNTSSSQQSSPHHHHHQQQHYSQQRSSH
ncbi:unnamed protein product, partial [Rotaria socialis]